MTDLILSTAYFPPIEYLSTFLQADNVYIESHENYIKQTYRNRCVIPTANGILPLTIPIKKGGLHNCPINQVQIDYGQPWQRTHWRALEAAYNASPFFTFYRDYLEAFFFQKEIKTLLEFNQMLFDIVLKLFGINKNYCYTEHYIENCQDPVLDLRNEIHPKKLLQENYPFRQPMPYRQVFSEKLGFISNLSCVDLLFNEGKYAKDYLVKSL